MAGAGVLEACDEAQGGGLAAAGGAEPLRNQPPTPWSMPKAVRKYFSLMALRLGASFGIGTSALDGTWNEPYSGMMRWAETPSAQSQKRRASAGLRPPLIRLNEPTS